MTHSVVKAHIPAAIERRIEKLPTKEIPGGLKIVENFGVFIDTHRDQPHVGTFLEDIHRGQCVPTMVNYVVGEDWLQHPESSKFLQRHDKHLFITPDEWQSFVVNWMLDHGNQLPFSGDGSLPTSHFRDPRKGLYLLKSFRQMVVWNLNGRQ